MEQQKPIKVKVFVLFQLGNGIDGKMFGDAKDNYFTLVYAATVEMMIELIGFIEEKYKKDIKKYGAVNIQHYQVLGYEEG